MVTKRMKSRELISSSMELLLVSRVAAVPASAHAAIMARGDAGMRAAGCLCFQRA